MAPSANRDVPADPTPSDDPLLVAWQDGHVERFRAAMPPCNCFACLASRAERVAIRRAPLHLFAAR
jgi:hypothetical protein